MSQNADYNERLTLEEIEVLMSFNDKQRDDYAVSILRSESPDNFDEFIELIRSCKVPHPVDIAIAKHHPDKTIDKLKIDFKNKIHVVKSEWENQPES